MSYCPNIKCRSYIGQFSPTYNWFGRKRVLSKSGPRWRFFVRGLNVKFLFSNPEKTSLRGTTSFDVLCMKMGSRAWTVGRWKNPGKRSRVNIFDAQFRTYTGIRNPLSDRDYILHVGRYPGDNCICNVWWRSVKGFGRGEGSNFPFPYWLASSPLQLSHYSASVYDDDDDGGGGDNDDDDDIRGSRAHMEKFRRERKCPLYVLFTTWFLLEKCLKTVIYQLFPNNVEACPVGLSRSICHNATIAIWSTI